MRRWQPGIVFLLSNDCDNVVSALERNKRVPLAEVRASEVDGYTILPLGDDGSGDKFRYYRLVARGSQ